MVKLDVLKQPPLVSFHSNRFTPTLMLVTEVLYDPGAVIVPPPAAIDHVPNPRVGVLPANMVVGELIHKVWLAPATDVPGTS